MVMPVSRLVQQLKADVTEAADESVVGIEMVQAFGREDDIRNRFGGKAEAVRDMVLRQAGVEARHLPGLYYLPALSIAAVVYFGGRQVIDGHLSIGQFVLFETLQPALDSGLLNRKVVDYLCAGGFTCVLWNCVPRDWEEPVGWVDRALAHCHATPWSVVVLHDLPTGAMLNLGRFIERVRDAGAEIVQEFPPVCVPILRGRLMFPIDQYMAA